MPRKGGNKRSSGNKGGGQAWVARSTTVESLASDADTTKLPEGNQIGEACSAEECAMQAATFGLLGMACDVEVAKKLEDGCLACAPNDVDKPSVPLPASAPAFLSNLEPSLPSPILSLPSDECSACVPTDVDKPSLAPPSSAAVAVLSDLEPRLPAPILSLPPAVVALPTTAEGSRLAHQAQEAADAAMVAAKEELMEEKEAQQFAEHEAVSTVEDQSPGTISVDRTGPAPAPSAWVAPGQAPAQPALVLASPLEAPPEVLAKPEDQERVRVQQAAQPWPEEDGQVDEGTEDTEVRPLTFCERCCGRAFRRRQLDAPLLRDGR